MRGEETLYQPLKWKVISYFGGWGAGRGLAMACTKWNELKIKYCRVGDNNKSSYSHRLTPKKSGLYHNN